MLHAPQCHFGAVEQPWDRAAEVTASRTIEIPVGCTGKVPLAVKTARQARMTLISKGRSALSQPGSLTGDDHDDRD
jgi:hypothetical protein